MGYKGCTPLLIASDQGRLKMVKYLVEEGADINTRDDGGWTPLHLASLKGHLEVVKWLVEKGADVNVKSFEGYTPLQCAVMKNNIDVVELLMYYGISFDNPKFNIFTMIKLPGRATLGDACRMQQLETAQALLQAGANWDVADTNGDSLLKHLTIVERPTFIKLLVENGAYLKPAEYNAIVKSSSLKVLQDATFCCQAIVNKFNNHDLPELYKVLASKSLPRIERIKIASGSEVTQAIERTVEFEIQTKGHCNILEVRLIALSVFSVASVLKYYTRHRN